MTTKHKYDFLSILSMLGLALTVYLTTAHYLGATLPCTVTHGCEVVLNSKYAVALGLPLSAWGAMFYFVVAVVALLANNYRAAKKILTVLLAVGTLISLVLLTLQFFVIKSVCQYCLVSDLLTIALLLLDLNLEYSPPGLQI
jgi:uncharacterized membrane protein